MMMKYYIYKKYRQYNTYIYTCFARTLQNPPPR